MTQNEFYKVYESHLSDSPREIPLRGDSYEMHYPNGDIYKHEEILKPGRTPSRISGTYFSDDFNYYNYWNGELITA